MSRYCEDFGGVSWGLEVALFSEQPVRKEAISRMATKIELLDLMPEE
jgi:hypothetical protein